MPDVQVLGKRGTNRTEPSFLVTQSPWQAPLSSLEKRTLTPRAPSCVAHIRCIFSRKNLLVGAVRRAGCLCHGDALLAEDVAEPREVRVYGLPYGLLPVEDEAISKRQEPENNIQQKEEKKIKVRKRTNVTGRPWECHLRVVEGRRRENTIRVRTIVSSAHWHPCKHWQQQQGCGISQMGASRFTSESSNCHRAIYVRQAWEHRSEL